MANKQIYQLDPRSLATTDVLPTQNDIGTGEAGKNTIQDIIDLVPTPIAGPGITVNGLEITASVRSVNGSFPTNGNIQTSLTATVTGTSASFQSSGSGAITGSLSDGLIWIITGETGPASGSNGDVYIYNSGSVGQWYPVAPSDQAANDARYLMLTPQSPLAGALDLGSNDITNGGTITATSFAGTASWANNSVTASYVLNAVSASNATTSSYVLNAVSASYSATASYISQVESASYALTASYVNPLTQTVSVVGDLTIVNTAVWNTGSLTVSSFTSKIAASTKPVLQLTSNETGAGSVYPSQLSMFQLGATEGWSLQSTNQGVGYTPLVLNPTGGTVKIYNLSATGSLLGTATTASHINPLTQDVNITGNVDITGITNTLDAVIVTNNSSYLMAKAPSGNNQSFIAQDSANGPYLGLQNSGGNYTILHGKNSTDPYGRVLALPDQNGTLVTDNYTGSISVTGSLTINSVLTLTVRTTNPANPVTGSLMMSGSSGANLGLYVYTGAGASSGWARASLT